MNPSVFNNARSLSTLADRRHEGEAEGNDGTAGKCRCQQRRGHSHGSVVHDLGGALHADDRDRVSLGAATGNVGKDIVGCGSDALQIGESRRCGDALAQSNEDEIRSVERGIRARQRLPERLRQGGVGHEGTRPHRGVVVDDARVSDGRQCRSSHDDETSRRDVYGISGPAIGHGYHVADPFVQLRQRGGAKDYLVLAVDVRGPPGSAG